MKEGWGNSAFAVNVYVFLASPSQIGTRVLCWLSSRISRIKKH
jgi:hypothetical protein